jgi:allantoicase
VVSRQISDDACPRLCGLDGRRWVDGWEADVQRRTACDYAVQRTRYGMVWYGTVHDGEFFLQLCAGVCTARFKAEVEML